MSEEQRKALELMKEAVDKLQLAHNLLTEDGQADYINGGIGSSLSALRQLIRCGDVVVAREEKLCDS